jgi:hypothetical protein
MRAVGYRHPASLDHPQQFLDPQQLPDPQYQLNPQHADTTTVKKSCRFGNGSARVAKRLTTATSTLL